MALDNDPRPVLRQELTRVFKNQRVVRAFEKIFDLVPPEFLNQQTQIDALNLISELAASQAVAAIDAVNQLTEALDRLAVAPAPVDVDVPDEPTPTLVFEYSFLIGDGLVGLAPNSRPAIDQSIAPIWTGEHKFRGAIGRAPSGSSEVRMGTIGGGAYPWAIWEAASGVANQKVWEVYGLNDGTKFGIQTLDDAVTTNKNAWSVTRAGNAVTLIEHGNAVDNPNHSFLGNKTPSHGGGQLVAGTAGFTNNAAAAVGTLNNAPVIGNPTKWIPINDNGVIRNIPAW